MKREKIQKVRLSNVELSILRGKAKESGISVAELLRNSGLNYDIPIKRFTVEQKDLYRQFAGVANNLNQLTKYYNTTGLMHEDINNTINQIKGLVKRFLEW